MFINAVATPNVATAARSARVHPLRRWPAESARRTTAAPITRNHAIVAGPASSNIDTAMTAPVYWEMPETTNSASGENRSSRLPDAGGGAVVVR